MHNSFFPWIPAHLPWLNSISQDGRKPSFINGPNSFRARLLPYVFVAAPKTWKLLIMLCGYWVFQVGIPSAALLKGAGVWSTLYPKQSMSNISPWLGWLKTMKCWPNPHVLGNSPPRFIFSVSCKFLTPRTSSRPLKSLLQSTLELYGTPGTCRWLSSYSVWYMGHLFKRCLSNDDLYWDVLNQLFLCILGVVLCLSFIYSHIIIWQVYNECFMCHTLA